MVLTEIHKTALLIQKRKAKKSKQRVQQLPTPTTFLGKFVGPEK
jgi:hypothetical protein